MENNYQILIRKLDEFIKRYYKNKLLRGLIFFSSFSLTFYLAVIIPEYYVYFKPTIKTIIFFSFILINISILTYWVIIPLLQMYKIGKTITHQQAADIIGKHFKNVEDKLLNTLQLKELADTNPYNKELIEASINKRINELKPIPFKLAINISKNIKYIKYTIVPLLIIIFLLIFSPNVITQSTKRIVKYNEFFEKEAPFRFIVLNDKLSAIKNEDFLLSIKIEGEQLPENLYINIKNTQYKLKKLSKTNFSYLFKNIQSDVIFQLTDGEYTSKLYKIIVFPNPTLINFSITLKYPAYIGKKQEILHNTGDLFIPEGTTVEWNFFTNDATNLNINFIDTSVSLYSDNKTQRFLFKRTFAENNYYTIIPSNSFVKSKDSVSYTISVLKDAYPEISVEEFKDSLNENITYFRGFIKDDYGFTSLKFIYKENSQENDSTYKTNSEIISIFPQTTEQQFFHFWDLSKISFTPGSIVEYYFEVWDNDGVNGSKSSKSQKKYLKIETQKEKEEKLANNSKEIKDKIEESIKLAREIQRELKDLDLKMLEKNSPGWEEKKKIENILEKNKQLQQNIQKINTDYQKRIHQSENDYKNNEILQEKYKQLQEMFNKLMNDDIKKLLEELQKLMENIDKNKIQEALDKMNLSTKDLEKELDRNLELFKQLEFDQKFDNIIKRIDEIKNKQEKLAEETLNKYDKKNAEEFLNKQNELNEEFKDLRKNIDELEKLNKELEKPNNLKNTDNLENEIQQEQQNSSEQLKQGKNEKAGKSQKNAAQKLEKLSEDMKKMKQEIEQEAFEEDLDNLRGILENLIKISFEQEDVILALKKININNPQYINLIQRQKKLVDDSKIVEDSLLALSKRVPEIQSVVNKEVNYMKNNMTKAIKSLEQRNTADAQVKQQNAMTSVNNLALMLSETFENMQDQKMQSSQQCKGGKCRKKSGKSGGSKMSIATMKKLQEELNKQIQQLKENLKDPSKFGNRTQQNLSEQLAKLAAQQEALRQELQKYAQSLKNDPNSKMKDMEQLAREMEKTETDLVNKLITTETIKRQQEILTRLLEYEKAEREREMEEKRESREWKEEFFRNPILKNTYKLNRLKGEDLLKTVPPSLSPYYKKKVNEYFNNFEQNL